jgi:hypothetical protein
MPVLKYLADTNTVSDYFRPGEQGANYEKGPGWSRAKNRMGKINQKWVRHQARFVAGKGVQFRSSLRLVGKGGDLLLPGEMEKHF